MITTVPKLCQCRLAGILCCPMLILGITFLATRSHAQQSANSFRAYQFKNEAGDITFGTMMHAVQTPGAPRYSLKSDFGCAGDGTTDDTGCLQAAFNSTCATSLAVHAITGSGLTYALSSSITIPACAGLALRDARFVKLPEFPSGNSLFQTRTSGRLPDGFSLEDALFENNIFDGGHVANLFTCSYCTRTKWQDNTFLHAHGLALFFALDGHDNVVWNNRFFEYLYPESGYDLGPFSATELQFDVHDSVSSNNIGGYTKVGLKLNATYDTSIGDHWYACNAEGWYITQNAAFTTLINPYADATPILIENPWNTSIVDGKFLVNSSSATMLNRAFITLRALSANLGITGLRVMGNSFHDSNAGSTAQIAVDGPGSFNTSRFADMVLTPNSFINVTRYSAWDAHTANGMMGTLKVGDGSTFKVFYETTASLTYTAIATGACQEQSVTLTGVVLGTDAAAASPLGNLGNNLAWSAWVNKNNTVAVRLCNASNSSASTPNRVIWRVMAWH